MTCQWRYFSNDGTLCTRPGNGQGVIGPSDPTICYCPQHHKMTIKAPRDLGVVGRKACVLITTRYTPDSKPYITRRDTYLCGDECEILKRLDTLDKESRAEWQSDIRRFDVGEYTREISFGEIISEDEGWPYEYAYQVLA